MDEQEGHCHRIERRLDRCIALLEELITCLCGPNRAVIELGTPQDQSGESDMAKLSSKAKKMKAGVPVDITDIQSDGATLVIVDGAGNPVTAQPDPTTVSVAWTSSDPTILTVTPDPTNSLLATVKSVGKLGTATIDATITFTSGTPAPLTAMQDITVTNSAPVSATIQLGVPTP